MSKRKELTCWKIVHFNDGTTKRLSIYGKGSSSTIVDIDSSGGSSEYSIHPSSRSIDDEIRVLFSNVSHIETEYPGITTK